MGFRFDHAIASGDSPRYIDRDLTLFHPVMPFVSVERLTEGESPAVQQLQCHPSGYFIVGGEDVGLAKFLAALMREAAHGDEQFIDITHADNVGSVIRNHCWGDEPRDDDAATKERQPKRTVGVSHL